MLPTATTSIGSRPTASISARVVAGLVRVREVAGDVATGTITSGVSVLVSGVAVVAAIGLAVVTGSAVASPSGVSMSASVGSVVASGAGSGMASPAGVNASFDVGVTNATGQANVEPSGVSAAWYLGTAVASGAGVGSAAPSGVSCVASVGSPAATGAANISVTGISAQASVGTAPAIGAGSIAASGLSAASSIGTVSASGAGSITATGVSTTSAIGTTVVTGGATIAATGVSITSALGTVVATGGGGFSYPSRGPFSSSNYFNASSATPAAGYPKSMFARVKALGSGSSMIAVCLARGDRTYDWHAIEFSAAGQIRGFIQKNGSSAATAGTAFSTGVWYNVGLVNTSTTLSLYVNGSLVDSVSHALSASSWEYAIGGRNTGSFGNFGAAPFNGYIAEVAFWNAALSGANFASLESADPDGIGVTPAEYVVMSDPVVSSAGITWSVVGTIGSGS